MSDTWEVGVAATKLRPPAPPVPLIRRSRLDAILDAGIDGNVRLALVSAPAGSGKSTLLASWLAGRAESVAWLQAEESDSDPVRFWSYLVDAIGRAHADVAAALRPVVVGSGGDDLVVVSALVNALAGLTEPLIVVIDDYHLIDRSSVHRGVERFIDLCPTQVTLLLATRVDPPFRLGRLRVRKQIAEIRGADLRFAVDEAPGLLGSAAQALDADRVGQLCVRTEGWAAGLVLAGLSLERAEDPSGFIDAFRGDDHLVVEYLRDEFLASTGEDDRRCLLEASILEQLTGPLVDAVTGTTGGGDWLRDTARVNQLLVRLDGTGTWFRLHHLLRDLLRLEAQQAFPERIAELHVRAAVWFEAHGDLGQAIEHRLAAGDPDEAAQLLRAHGTRLLAEGRVETLRGLLVRLGEVAEQVTWCSLLFGWCEYVGGRYAGAARWLDITCDAAAPTFDRLIATPLRVNIALARGDVATALETVAPLTMADLESHPCDLATAAGAAHAWAGDAEVAGRCLRLAVERSEVEGIRTAHVLALVYLAVVVSEAGSREDAHRAATTVLDTATGFGLADYHGVAVAYAIRARTTDDPDAASADSAQAVALATRASTDLSLGYVLTLCGDRLMERDDPGGAALLAEAHTVLDRCPDPGIAGRRLARVTARHGVSVPGSTPIPALVEQLTEREVAVLRYLPTDLSQREIAVELYVSLNTVKTHSSAIYRKLGVGDRKAAVQAARDLGVV